MFQMTKNGRMNSMVSELLDSGFIACHKFFIRLHLDFIFSCFEFMQMPEAVLSSFPFEPDVNWPLSSNGILRKKSGSR